MLCNRCGGCCDSLSDAVSRDEDNGLPMFTWGSKFPDDYYEARYGVRLLNPVIVGDGGPVVGGSRSRFEVDSAGTTYTAFQCTFLEQGDGGDGTGCATTCGLRKNFPDPDPKKLEQIRPRNCGEFPVFGLDLDATILEGNTFVVPTGALPLCTWHGIRVTGPWKDTPYYVERWEKQQRGESVPPIPPVKPEIIAALLARRETIDGSVRNQWQEGRVSW